MVLDNIRRAYVELVDQVPYASEEQLKLIEEKHRVLHDLADAEDRFVEPAKESWTN